MKLIVAVILLGLLGWAAADEWTERDYDKIVEETAIKFGAHISDLEFPTIDYNELLKIALEVGSGFLAGTLERMNDTDGQRCFDNFKNVTAVINYVQNIIAHGLEKETWPMIRQLLVLGVMVLNVTIEEMRYCMGLYAVVTGFLNTFRCMLGCPRQYYVLFARRLLMRSYDYFYYGKETIREFINKNYHLSGNWLAYTLDSLYFVYGGCYSSGGLCYVPPDPDPVI